MQIIRLRARKSAQYTGPGPGRFVLLLGALSLRTSAGEALAHENADLRERHDTAHLVGRNHPLAVLPQLPPIEHALFARE